MLLLLPAHLGVASAHLYNCICSNPKGQLEAPEGCDYQPVPQSVHHSCCAFQPVAKILLAGLSTCAVCAGVRSYACGTALNSGTAL